MHDDPYTLSRRFLHFSLYAAHSFSGAERLGFSGVDASRNITGIMRACSPSEGRGRHLYHPLAPNEVYLEWRPHGIAGILNAGYLLACFTQKAVIKSSNQGLVAIEIHNFLLNTGKYFFAVEPLFAI